jgi:hypothetical protein
VRIFIFPVSCKSGHDWEMLSRAGGGQEEGAKDAHALGIVVYEYVKMWHSAIMSGLCHFEIQE